MGLHLGPSRIVDVDLDCPEAVALAPLLLPSCPSAMPLVYGRASTPRAHWLYLDTGCEYVKCIHGGETLVELRCGHGLQSMAPPSVHPCGEVVTWEGDDGAGTLAAYPPAVLARQVQRIAAAVVLMRAGRSPEDAAAVVEGPPLAEVTDERTRAWCGWPSLRPPAPVVTRSGDGAERFAEARDAYCRENGRAWPARRGACPVCGGSGFGALPGGDRWSCHSTRHTSGGHQGPQCWVGDVLDLDVAVAGRSLSEHLRATGYLRGTGSRTRSEGPMPDGPPLDWYDGERR